MERGNQLANLLIYFVLKVYQLGNDTGCWVLFLFPFFFFGLKGYFVVLPCVPRTPSVAAAAAGYTPSYPSEGQGDCAGCHSNRLLVHHDDSPGLLPTIET